MALLGGIALLAAVTLDDRVRWVTLALLALFAVKIWIAYRRQQMEAAQDAEEKLGPM